MLFDAALPPVSLQSVPEIVRAAESFGFDGIWVTETIHDPFLPGAIIAEHTRGLEFGTAVAIAFGRSPATLAYTAWDLAQASNGRFILGLGTQVKPHIEKRFGMPWPDSVTGKLGEQIDAIRAFWHSWQSHTPLSFRGDYYRLSLMTPFFDPGPISHPKIPIYIAGVNTGLARLAGEKADGFLFHPFHSPQYLAEVLIPAILLGLDRSGRSRPDITLSVTAFAITSPEDELLIRSQIGFYASTPSYRAVMEHHGWGDTAEKASMLVRLGRWGDLPELVSTEMLETFAVVCSPDDLGTRLKQRYSSLADRLSIYLPFIPGQRDEFWKALLTEMKR